MANFWKIGDNYINPDHVVRCYYIRPYAGGEEDYELAEGELTKPRPAKMVIYLSELTDHTITEYDDRTIGVVATSKWITVTGTQAERLADWLDAGAYFPADEPMEGESDEPPITDNDIAHMFPVGGAQ